MSFNAKNRRMFRGKEKYWITIKRCWLRRKRRILPSMVFLCLLLYLLRNSRFDYFDISTNDYLRCSVLSMSTPEDLSDLTEINLNGCALEEIPASIRHASKLQKLDLSNNPLLTTLPDELKYCTNLDVLFVSSCPSIESLPPVLGQISSLTRLGWRSGSLNILEADNIPPNLVHLILTNNRLEFLDDPRLFFKLKHVKKLMLSHNQIQSFGTKGGLEQLTSLELLRLGGNQLTKIPSELWKLPKLTWLTISDNPVTDAYKLQSSSKIGDSLASIHQTDLSPIGKYLGQGASGKVELYNWKGQNVAVKLIHGVTSDGNAEDELAIYRSVGSSGMGHRVVGCTALLEGQRKGVVMLQIPPHFVDLALPPTIREVTTDRWAGNESFSPNFVKNVLRDSVNALHFLHEQIGVAHGDFYAHNIKVDSSTGRAFLLDFGASYFKGNAYSRDAEKLEVRAFGVLIGELLERLDVGEVALSAKLRSLRSKCIDTKVEDRPIFDEIKRLVDAL
mmetsp:Transcript_7580/g.11572  ORF Transcript_7580/g.11572 Transcript_7580/m.11572 type:complete len:504 (+) Transcript_7580:39-1550(+)